MTKHFLRRLSAIAIVCTLPAITAVAQDRPEDPKAVIAAFATAIFEEQNFDALPELMREDYIQHNPLVQTGRAGFEIFFKDWFAASPDFHYELKRIVSEGDLVWVHGSYKGTHSHDWLGVPATGAVYAFDAVDIFRIEDGKLAEHWDVLDAYTLFKQLGAI